MVTRQQLIRIQFLPAASQPRFPGICLVGIYPCPGINPEYLVPGVLLTPGMSVEVGPAVVQLDRLLEKLRRENFTHL